MQLQTYLRSRTRQPEFLGRMMLIILAVGLLLAFVVQASEPNSEEGGALLRVSDQQGAIYDKLTQLSQNRQWVEYWWTIPRYMWHSIVPGPALLAGLTGICWFVFIVQAGQPHRQGGIRWPLAAVAVVLGVLSIWPTLFAVDWQRIEWNLVMTDDLRGGLRFFILGVGLREELSKLLLFLPLVPWIIRRGSEREALLVAACVGLGFAMEENIGYFLRGEDASGRFLTANFFHMATTGLCGLAVCRAIWNPRQRLGEAIAIVLLMIVGHGLYDAVIVLPSLQMYGIFSFLLIVGLAYWFFHELRTWWQSPGETISLTATFLASVSIIVAATLVYLSSLVGLQQAAQLVILPTLALGLTVYMFLREMPESIIDV
ncbi:PrsW family intramembrane metalloprotease [Aeoliella sp. ICT_H6.2]|uniref:PrsW family intramembrane metalloprotease n=1 Tax=Aeoliella straminimaris TaxID=2954799 RepID=A0A9X2FEN7_9BACT|nr:PrsW family glutamic-type intramembrane protease [Aeoliella straminimaris]MCO6046793.1 PrsW family intramembrane metalloprotease [Aeoliella straminimaris]